MSGVRILSVKMEGEFPCVMVRRDMDGRILERTLRVSVQEFTNGLIRRRDGAMIQNAFPTMSADDREFLKTGITPEEWAEIFRKE